MGKITISLDEKQLKTLEKAARQCKRKDAAGLLQELVNQITEEADGAELAMHKQDTPVVVILRKQDVDRLAELANKEGRTASNEVRQALEDYKLDPTPEERFGDNPHVVFKNGADEKLYDALAVSLGKHRAAYFLALCYCNGESLVNRVATTLLNDIENLANEIESRFQELDDKPEEEKEIKAA